MNVVSNTYHYLLKCDFFFQTEINILPSYTLTIKHLMNSHDGKELSKNYHYDHNAPIKVNPGWGQAYEMSTSGQTGDSDNSNSFWHSAILTL